LTEHHNPSSLLPLARSSVLAAHAAFQMNPIACPKLEELIFCAGERFDVDTVTVVAAARALGGSPLKSVRIITLGELVARGE